MEDCRISMVRSILCKFYTERDIEGVFDSFSEQVTWIGPGEKEMIFDHEEVKNYFLRGRDRIPKCELEDDCLAVVYEGAGLCMVAGSVTIRSKEETGMLTEVTQRVSFLLGGLRDNWKIIHMHLSNPYMEMKGEEYFPAAAGKQSYEYLQRLLQEKMEVINMINSNIEGGLKGSNDDEAYSYFYVNEGLPRMLGYTYEEFMEKTGGTAVGAVYPPDLEAALKMVDDCFAKGSSYRAEYRMEKKDKSLIWVMDTGRKARDSCGTKRINSIITDITPLKKALADLELERERYRVALDSITDVLCEYDIEEDLFIRFQKVELHNKVELEKVNIPDFSRSVLVRNMLLPEELDQFMDAIRGKTDKTLEIHTRYIHSNSGWRLSRLYCSIVYDSNQKPVKTLGVLKDITDERAKEIRLIQKAETDGLTQLMNQTSMRVKIQEYLKDSREEKERGAILALDLDRFKPVNDTRGHLFGNHILIEVAKILKSSIGKADLAGRIGGDEFLLLIKEKDREGIRKTAAGILKEINEMAAKEEAATSCSIGIAFLSPKDISYEDIFQRADQALYRVKHKGGADWEEWRE